MWINGFAYFKLCFKVWSQKLKMENFKFVQSKARKYLTKIQKNSIVISKFGITITGNDTMSLMPCKRLNDNIINFCLELIRLRSLSLESGNIFKGSCYEYFLYEQNDFPRVQRCATLDPKDWYIYEWRYFSSCLYEPSLDCSCYSLQGKKNPLLWFFGQKKWTSVEWIGTFLTEEYFNKTGHLFNSVGYDTEVADDIPLKRNNFDCGVFALIYANAISLGKSISFDQSQMEYLRNKIVLEIVKGKLFD